MTTAPVGANAPRHTAKAPARARKPMSWEWAPRANTYILVGLTVLGLILRIRRPDLPENFTFDEALFVKNAHHYLIGSPDDNDHPPLGKLLMALGQIAFDYNSLGWRFTSVCFGVLTVYMAYLLGKNLFASERAGYFSAALIAADGFFIAYSRAGLLDGVLCCLILWTVLAAVVARNFWDVLITGLLLGLATSVKWSGAFAVFPAALALVLLQRLPWYWVPALGISLIVHVLIWMIGLHITGKPSDLPALWGVMKGLFHHHLDLGSRDN
ncbi:MAG TPA: phospholipid carrier-dependent glycosyltransferase, partial [Polyangiaceae bacterium]|nr:phospholipid carrier-dependent glycosyltransferase [Polyangiaceae bacterium]